MRTIRLVVTAVLAAVTVAFWLSSGSAQAPSSPDIVASPDPVEIDGSSGVGETSVEFSNTGDVTVNVADVVLEPASDEFDAAMETCLGDLASGDECTVVVAFVSDEPGPFDVALLLLDRAGDAITSVGVTATGPPATQGGTSTSEGGEEPATTAPGSEEGDESEGASGGDQSSDDWVLWVVVGGGVALLAVATAVAVRRRARSRALDRVEVEARADDGTQRVVDGDAPLVTLRATLNLGDGITTITEDRGPDT